MAGGKGKSTGGKAGPKDAAGKTQKSHSAKAGLQVSVIGRVLPCVSDVEELLPARPMLSSRRVVGTSR